MEKKLNKIGITSATLHIIAMILMLFDHSWSTLFPSHRWLTVVGRIAYPIFAFMTAEGYFHTHDFKKYLTRMFIFALISEIPFNLMMGGNIFGPYHQNVIWTFIIALLGMKLMDVIRSKGKLWLSIVGCFLVTLICFILGFVTFADYFGAGVLMVITFYFFHEKKWWCYIGQFAMMYWINVELLGGYYSVVNIFGFSFELIEQGVALVALIPIWLYNGQKGHNSKFFQYFCYWFYPLHMLALVVIGYLTQM